MYSIFWNLLSHFLDSRAAKFGIICTYNHDNRKTRDPIHSPVNKSVRARLSSWVGNDQRIPGVVCIFFFLGLVLLWSLPPETLGEDTQQNHCRHR